MSEFLKSFLIAFAIVSLMAYLAGVFYELSFDPSKWSQETRGGIVFFWTCITSLVATILYVDKG